jgi:hypothetical protein
VIPPSKKGLPSRFAAQPKIDSQKPYDVNRRLVSYHTKLGILRLPLALNA